jgi:hypothetical protein
MHLYLYENPIRLQPGHDPGITLPLSLAALLEAGLQRFPPTEAALEQAIASTEDALMPQIPALRAHPSIRLDCTYAVLEPLYDLLALPAQPVQVLEIEQVERAFNQIAQVAAGMPARTVGLQERPDFVAALLVVRELMHHVGWRQLRLGNPAGE